jgi:hypothetical protein
MWPVHVNFGRFTASALWLDEQRAQHPGQELQDVWKVRHDFIGEAKRRFNELDDEKKAAYKARSEQLRQETWDEWEEYQRRRDSGELLSLSYLPYP